MLLPGPALITANQPSIASPPIYTGHGIFPYAPAKTAPAIAVTSDIVVNNGKYNAFPWVEVNQFGTLVAIWREATSHVSTDGRIMLSTSLDGSAGSWTTPVAIFTPAGGHDYRTGGGIVTLHNGRMVVGFFDYNGSVGTALMYGYSDDGGTTWAGPYTVSPTPYSSDQRAECAMFQHSSGRVIWPIYGRDTGDSADRNGLLYSDDNCGTWSSRINLTAQNSGYNEWYPREEADGTLVAHIRTDANPNPIRSSPSTDRGITWGALTSLGWNVVPSRPTVVRFRVSGALIQFYRDTANGYTYYGYSFDDGVSWTSGIQLSAILDEYVGGVPISDNLVGVVVASEVTTTRADVRYYALAVVPSGALAPGQGPQITAANSITVTNQMHQVTGTTTIKNIYGYIPSGAILYLSAATVLNFDSTGNVYATGASGTRAVPANSAIALVYDGVAGNWRVCGVGS